MCSRLEIPLLKSEKRRHQEWKSEYVQFANDEQICIETKYE